MTEKLEEARLSLERMQKFDVGQLVREKDFGSKNFATVVVPAQRLVDLYNRLSIDALLDFPEEKLNAVKERANNDYQLFAQVLEFDVDKTTAQRDALVQTVTDSYNRSFDTLHPLIAYSLHRSADFQRLDAQARSTLQDIRDNAASLTRDLEEARAQSVRIVEEVRATAAEAGVSQKAYFFREEADGHQEESEKWRKTTVRMAWATGLYALASLFIHKIPLLEPNNTYETVQIAVSKILIFGVLSFILYLSARNFLSHKHNAIVNRHRQQALQTYQALVDAAGEGGAGGIVLTHAASCIFGQQSTGYAPDSNQGAPSAQNVIELMGNIGSRSHGPA